MSKFLVNLLLQISKALVNSKIQFLIQKFFFLFRPGRPCCPPGLSAQPAHWPRRPPQAESAQPAHLARASVASSREIRFPFQITPSRAGRLLPLSLPCGPHLSASSSPPRRRTLVRIFPAPPLPRAAASCFGCPRAFTALPHHCPLLIPFKPSVNGP
jgi:hypothetical protein